MKVLNLYAGIGGNRKLWEDVDVTAVEWDKPIASIYQDFFPDDEVLIMDAHEFLLDNYQDYDFIWSSPPCPTHSILNRTNHAKGQRIYPDMRLWQEIIYLKSWFKGHWVVENVKSFYEPLYQPIELDRHYLWSNFHITPYRVNRSFNITNSRRSTELARGAYINKLEEHHGIVLPEGTKRKKLLLSNCVYPPMGLHILNCARRNTQLSLRDFGNVEVAEYMTKGDNE